MSYETDRLSIRRATLEDWPFILRLLNEPSWLEFIGDKKVRTQEDAEEYIRSTLLRSYLDTGLGLRVVETKVGRVPAGLCGLIDRESLDDVDLGYAFLPEHWGFGYAFEAARGALWRGREVRGLERVVAVTLPSNVRCIRLLERLGFDRERSILLGEDPEPLDLYAMDLRCIDRDGGG